MSGIRFNGGASRCWNSWQKFIDCYTAKDTADPLKSCKLFAEDYHECLHHTKEIERANKISAEVQRKEAAGEELPKSEVRRGLKYSLTDLDYIK